MPKTTKDIKKEPQVTEKKVENKANSQKLTTKNCNLTQKTKVVTKLSKKILLNKTTYKKVVSLKQVSKNKKSIPQKANIEVLEYYDLPYRYNNTVVKILAQTPNTLFVYWDISDNDRKFYEEKYKKDFFQNTKPVLIIKNATMNYQFEIDINDFANSWYFHINDSMCDYVVELGRRPINHHITLPNNYLPITSSNNIETPNDHILIETLNNPILFKNVQTNKTYLKNVENLTVPNENGSLLSFVSTFYNKMYEGESLSFSTISLKNPSSTFK